MAPSIRQSSNIFLAIVGFLLSSIILCDAAPLTSRIQSRSYSNNTLSSNTTTPTGPLSAGSSPITTGIPSSQPLATIFPDYTSQYNARNGAVDFHTTRGLVSRSPTNGGADITTLVTFAVDSRYSSNMCQLVFDLEDSSSSASGSLKAQLFTSLAPATADTETWPSGNLRDQPLGSIDIVAGGRATWEKGSGPGATADGLIPCSTIAGKIYGGEIVPQGDSLAVSWPAGQDGIKIIVW
ncbi:hypothetical protein A1O1_08289 [Capronia coronata CBS 617.96]|uniref:Ubiquitin 3 binding protein But2 C-terminal domain-containing protein n=1 Tax=Capronia coronata CBS 617.96 TaxID=1182541 RepID=W9XHZ5_9EURO|nr:uncharacterized protein A1O1_08289 [Capronia coronata CBS 617.96]EXJ80147.1 hypothetical protein A1O1_08289 [Capronia coronata CBS 617.96]